MPQLEIEARDWLRRPLRIAAIGVGLSLLLPFIMLALAPMLLFITPVAIVGIPFLVPAFLTGSLAARAESRRMVSARPALSVVRVAR